MILHRRTALWVAAFAAALNVAVIVFGVPLTAEGVAALNAGALALVALVGNESDPTTALTAGAQGRLAMRLSGGSLSGTGSLSTSPGDASGGTPPDTSTDPTAGGGGAAGGS